MVDIVKGTCIRIFSCENEWMDCIFLVDKKDTEKAKEVLEKAWNDFWEEETSCCYGDFLKDRMKAAGIEFEIFFTDEVD